MERIIDVYYDRYGYPFKDRELTARFPVVGSEFLGASQTTTIRFHYEQIGTDENVYTIESKRPDGKTGSQLLSKNTTEHYAEMSLSGWYSECKGDLFLSLKVYRGGTTATYNEETQLWEVNGIPVIESTGAIKLAINYTPMGRYENYNDAVSTYQDVLAALGDKLDTIKGIVVVSGLSQVDTTKYEEGQLFFNIDDKALYQLVNGSIVPFLEVYSKSETNGLLDEKADKSTTYTKTEIDDLLTDKQDKLVSGTNIKTINNISLLGSGNIDIQGGGNSEWGSIGGDIADQTDLQNELQDIREVAEGKTSTYVISDDIEGITQQTFVANEYKRADGTPIATWADFLSYVEDSNTCSNTLFDDDSVYKIDVGYTYLITVYNRIIKTNTLKNGDNIIVVQLDVPDRWYNEEDGCAYPLETSKIDLDNYSTKTETSTEVNKVAHDIAVEYDENTLYGVGDLCIKDKLLYKCNTDNTTGTWDSTKWDLTTVNSELGIIKGDYVDLTSAQTITGEKTFVNNVKIKNETENVRGWTIQATTWGSFRINDNSGNTYCSTYSISGQRRFGPGVDATNDLGAQDERWKNLYLSEYIQFSNDSASGSAKWILEEDNYGQFTISRIYNGIKTTYWEFNGTSLQPKSNNANNIGTQTRSLKEIFTNKISDSNGNSAIVVEITKKPSTSYSLTDGGTITDNSLKTLIQNEQPIKLNGFTCYFSCDDGTNYQYVSTRYDATANKNHINVITINKTTWVATFHTSDLTLS